MERLTLYRRALGGIIAREVLRFVQQRGRFLASLVRPLVWLIIFAAGFRQMLDVTIAPPYQAPVPYDVYIVPGLIGMVQLFNGMQSSLSMVYDREMGSMKVLMTTPLPRPFLLFAKLLAGTFVSILQVYAFLGLAALMGITFSLFSYALLLPAILLSGLMLGAVGILLSSTVRQLENFAGVMNFVIFPAFFLSSALYPLDRMRESSAVLWQISAANPFTHAVELIRFALHGQANLTAAAIVTLTLALCLALAFRGYDPARGLTPGARRGE